MFDPVSPPAEWIRYLAILALVVTGIIFLIVEGILIYSLIRFPRRKGAADTEPPQVYGSIPIEIAWTVGPALIVFLLVLVVIRTELEIRTNPDQPPRGSEPLYVTVVGHQWWWEYRYTRFGDETMDVVTANELHVPTSEAGKARPVYLDLQSVDVCHSFWVPRLGGKIDLIPGKANALWFQTGQPGLYKGQCAEFCGTQHANMLIRVNVDPPKVFRDWLENQKKGEAEAAKAHPGRAVFLSQSCINCHRVRGTIADDVFGKGTQDQTRFGPDLTHLRSRQTLASGMVPNDRENLRQWVFDPQQIKPGCRMPAMNLSDRDVDLVVDYLWALE